MIRCLALALLLALPALADSPAIGTWSHARIFNSSEGNRAEYQLPLGALQKIGGRWRFKDSELLSGHLRRVTWQVNEGFTAEEGFEWMLSQLPDDAELLFECRGRACGSSAQWASRVFNERVLYGHAERQRYAAYRIEGEDGAWSVVLYAVDRANRKHYLHMDLLKHGQEG